MIGADDMAFPTLNMLSYWFMWPAFILYWTRVSSCRRKWCRRGLDVLSAFVGPPWDAAPSSGMAQTTVVDRVSRFVGVSSMMGSVNYMTTIIQMRAPGMTMFRLPLTIWAMFITADASGIRVAGSDGRRFHADYRPDVGDGILHSTEGNLVINNSDMATSGGGQPLLWQHLFWFYSHPAVYIMILAGDGDGFRVSSAAFAAETRFLATSRWSIRWHRGSRVWDSCGLGTPHVCVSGMNPAIWA